MRRTIFTGRFNSEGEDYDSGHLIADSLGGPNVVENLVPMLTTINQNPGAWRRMEEWTERCLGNSETEGIMSIRVSYNSSATGVEKYIPTQFRVQLLLSDSPANSKIHNFSIRNSTGAPFREPDSCL